MYQEFSFDSCGNGKIHVCKWVPECTPKAVVQIVHGIAEYAARYDEFADYLVKNGYMVVAEDHMGHGGSIGPDDAKGYFSGGWFAAVKDTYRLLQLTREEYPDVPYILFGHSMGSFMVRTILLEYPDSGISGCVICGTGWMPELVMNSGLLLCKATCKRKGEKNPSDFLNMLIFGTYNKRVERPKTNYDWLNRDARLVDLYVKDPLCGFVPSAGLLRDMLVGMLYNQKTENLRKMKKDLPVYFIAGGDDPVGNYGKGVKLAAENFGKAGMQNVLCKIYPLCRHEILNEINKQEVFNDVLNWLVKTLN